MRRVRLDHRLLFAVVALFAALLRDVGPIFADRVEFRDGNRIDNVRVLLFGGRVNLVFEDGSIQVYREDQIERIENHTVSWADEVFDEEDFEQRARLRIFRMQEAIRERERARLEAEAVERRSILYYSLAFPGLGQFIDGSPARGRIFSVAAAALSVSIVDAHAERHKARRNYEDLSGPLTNIILGARVETLLVYGYQELYLRERLLVYREARDTYEGLWISLLAVWLMSAVDAYFFSDAPALEIETPVESEAATTAWPDLRLRPQHASIVWSIAL